MDKKLASLLNKHSCMYTHIGTHTHTHTVTHRSTVTQTCVQFLHNIRLADELTLGKLKLTPLSHILLALAQNLQTRFPLKSWKDPPPPHTNHLVVHSQTSPGTLQRPTGGQRRRGRPEDRRGRRTERMRMVSFFLKRVQCHH